MDEREVAQYWDENAPTWTRLSRMGCDTFAVIAYFLIIRCRKPGATRIP